MYNYNNFILFYNNNNNNYNYYKENKEEKIIFIAISNFLLCKYYSLPNFAVLKIKKQAE